MPKAREYVGAFCLFALIALELWTLALLCGGVQ